MKQTFLFKIVKFVLNSISGILTAFSCRTSDSVSEQHIQLIIDTGVAPTMLQLLSHYDVQVQENAFSVLRMILRGSEAQKEIILDCNFISYLESILNHQDYDVKNNAIDCLVNIAAGSCKQKQTLINFFSNIILHLKDGNIRTKKLSASFFLNFSIKANQNQIQEMVAVGVIKTLCSLIESPFIEIVQVSKTKLFLLS